MSRFERTQSNFIKGRIEQEINQLRPGKVLRVYEHKVSTDNSNFEVDVRTDGGTRIERAAAISQVSTDDISVPQVGDTVVIGFFAGENDNAFVLGTVNTSLDRPPIGVAGMNKSVVESGESPAGPGDLEVTKYTNYDKNVAFEDKNTATPEEAYVQITKGEQQKLLPDEGRDTPAKVEVYDSPANDEAHISIELNKVGGEDTDGTWGIKFDLKTGTFELADSSGFGIESDGSGNFTFHHKTIDFNEVAEDVGPLDL